MVLEIFHKRGLIKEYIETIETLKILLEEVDYLYKHRRTKKFLKIIREIFNWEKIRNVTLMEINKELALLFTTEKERQEFIDKHKNYFYDNQFGVFSTKGRLYYATRIKLDYKNYLDNSINLLKEILNRLLNKIKYPDDPIDYFKNPILNKLLVMAKLSCEPIKFNDDNFTINNNNNDELLIKAYQQIRKLKRYKQFYFNSNSYIYTFFRNLICKIDDLTQNNKNLNNVFSKIFNMPIDKVNIKCTPYEIAFNISYDYLNLNTLLNYKCYFYHNSCNLILYNYNHLNISKPTKLYQSYELLNKILNFLTN